jgi:hypothetical protein
MARIFRHGHTDKAHEGECIIEQFPKGQYAVSWVLPNGTLNVVASGRPRFDSLEGAIAFAKKLTS